MKSEKQGNMLEKVHRNIYSQMYIPGDEDILLNY